MKAAQFDYVQPRSLADAMQALADTVEGQKLMCGGQSLGPMLNLRLTRPSGVVDVSRLQELKTVTVDGETISIGASVTHAEIEDGVHALLRGTMLQQVAGGIAYRAIRTRGTLGGSLAHADPAADWVLTMTALAAKLELCSSRGKRLIPVDQFMEGAYTTVLQPDELITAVLIAKPRSLTRWGYYKFCRKPGEFAEASCAAVFDADRAFARVVIGALDGAPQNLPSIASAVASSGSLPSEPEIIAAIEAVTPGKDSVGRKLLAVSVRRCISQVIGRKEVR